MNIGELVAAQKAFFRSGATLDSRFRRAQLEKLLSARWRGKQNGLNIMQWSAAVW